jgi:hypothetical protein
LNCGIDASIRCSVFVFDGVGAWRNRYILKTRWAHTIAVKNQIPECLNFLRLRILNEESFLQRAGAANETLGDGSAPIVAVGVAKLEFRASVLSVIDISVSLRHICCRNKKRPRPVIDIIILRSHHSLRKNKMVFLGNKNI